MKGKNKTSITDEISKEFHDEIERLTQIKDSLLLMLKREKNDHNDTLRLACELHESNQLLIIALEKDIRIRDEYIKLVLSSTNFLMKKTSLYKSIKAITNESIRNINTGSQGPKRTASQDARYINVSDRIIQSIIEYSKTKAK